MQNRFTMFRRGKVFYCEDRATGQQKSLLTHDKAEALQLINARDAANFAAEDIGWQTWTISYQRKSPRRKLRAGFLKSELSGGGGTAAGEIKTTGADASEHQAENSQGIGDWLRHRINVQRPTGQSG
jgi:hypothetical protein